MKQSNVLTDYYSRYIELSFKIRDNNATVLEQAEFYSLQASWRKPKPVED